MTVTPKLDLPLQAAAEKHVTHKEALMALDALLHLRLISLTEPTPPAEPDEQSPCFAPEDVGSRFGGPARVFGGGRLRPNRDSTLRIRHSADGSSFHDAMVVDPVSGLATIT